MNILAIANNKGGVGKTTSTQNIGAAIGVYSESKTLLVDLDPQANLSKSFGFYLQPGQAHVGNFLLGKSSFEDTIINYNKTNIDILPASMELIQEEDNLKRAPQFPFNLIRALEQNSGKKQYDYVVIDCPPMLSTFTTIGLVACQRYYVPIQAEFFSYEGLREFINYAYKIASINNQLQLGGVFASRFNPHMKKNFSKGLIQVVKEQLNDKFLNTYIRENIALSEAQAKGKHIFEYDVKSHGAKDYYELTKEIILS